MGYSSVGPLIFYKDLSKPNACCYTLKDVAVFLLIKVDSIYAPHESWDARGA